MEEQQQTAPAPATTEATEKKPERIDELDILGGALVKLVIKGVNKVKQLINR